MRFPHTEAEFAIFQWEGADTGRHPDRLCSAAEAPAVHTSEALLGKNARGVVEPLDGALGIGQGATADRRVDNRKLSDTTAHRLGPVAGLVGDGVRHHFTMGCQRRLAEPRDADGPGTRFPRQPGGKHRLDSAP
jgi:hypothetical protein